MGIHPPISDAMTVRRFPLPGTVEDLDACFIARPQRP
jgi:hypothetical protein